MNKSESNDYNTVVKLYYKNAETDGFIPQQPSKNASFAGRKYFYLHNSYGLLAKYNMKEKVFVEP